MDRHFDSSIITHGLIHGIRASYALHTYSEHHDSENVNVLYNQYTSDHGANIYYLKKYTFHIYGNKTILTCSA